MCHMHLTPYHYIFYTLLFRIPHNSYNVQYYHYSFQFHYNAYKNFGHPRYTVYTDFGHSHHNLNRC